MSRIFLSHSGRDNFEAVAVRDWLAAEGWDEIFLDLDPERGIAAGERWERALHAAAMRCEAVIFLVSSNWLASGWCMREYALARGLNKKLFAALIEPGKKIDDLPPELIGTWQVVDLVGGQDMQILRTLLPGSHEERHVTFSREGLRRLKRGLEKAGLDPKFFAWPPEKDRERSPYRGLKPLESVDAGIFFGREAPIIEATDRLRGLRAAAAPRLLVLLGASGAGKSSFLRAGLMPRLARDDSHFLPLPAIRPERAALFGESGLLGALEAALPTRTRGDLRAAIHAGATGVRPLLAELVETSFKRTLADEETAKPPTIVMTVDQAEELFRADGAAEGGALLDLIRDLTTDDQPAVIAIFAIRSDSYDALEHAKPFEGLPQSTLPLLPMPRGAYKDVIEGPAWRFVEAGGKLTIEPQLTQRLLDDLDKGGGSDVLPLLAFTLEQLFLEHGRAGALRLTHYETFNGLKGAIDAAVKRAFLRADADPRIPRERAARETLLRRGLIPWLAGIDPDTKSPRRNIARGSDIPAEAAPLIDLLVEERLLTTDTAVARSPVTDAESRIVTIEPAHEALLRQWGLLQGWLAEDFGLLTALESVKRASRDWDANGRSEAWLAHQGQRLAEAQALDARPDIAAKLDAVDRGYLACCRAKEDAAHAEAEARRKEREEEQARALRDAQAIAAANGRVARRTGIGAAAALVLAIAAGGAAKFAIDRGSEAERERLAALEQTAVAQTQRTLAERRQKEAETQKKIADQNFAAAKQTVKGIVFDLGQGLEDVAGIKTETVQTLLRTAEKPLEELLQRSPDDLELLRTKVAMLGVFSRVLGKLGDAKDEMETGKAAIGAARILLQSPSHDAGDVHNFVSISIERGRASGNNGDWSVADSAFAEAYQAVQEEFQRSDAVSPAKKVAKLNLLTLDLASICLDRGQLLLRSSERWGEAEAWLRRSFDAYEGYAAHENDGKGLEGQAMVLAQLADVHGYIGRGDQAKSDYEQAIVIFKELIRERPERRDLRHDLAMVLRSEGAFFARSNDLMGALAARQESLGVMRDLMLGDPTNERAAAEYRLSLKTVGRMKIDTGDASGLGDMEAVLTLDRETIARHPGEYAYQYDLAIDLKDAADYLAKENRVAEALKDYAESLDIQNLAVAQDNNNLTRRSNLSDLLDAMGDLQSHNHDLAAAIDTYRSELALAQEDRAPSTNQEQKIIQTMLKLGDSLSKSDRLSEALEIYRKGVDAIRAAGAQESVTVVAFLQRIGDSLRKVGDLNGAVESLIAARKIVKELLDKTPSDAGALYNMAIISDHIGEALLAANRVSDAEAAFDEGVNAARLRADVLKSDANATRFVADFAKTIADAELAGGEITQALQRYDAGLQILRATPAGKDDQIALQSLVSLLGSFAFAKLEGRQFTDSLRLSEEAIQDSPDQLWLETNQAHALMFLGRTQEARRIYLDNAGKALGDGGTWNKAILADFATFAKLGLTDPLMTDITQKLKSSSSD